jgi:hypothetical protein
MGWRFLAKMTLVVLFGLCIFMFDVFPAKDVANLREMMATWTRTRVVPKLRWAGLI